MNGITLSLVSVLFCLVMVYLTIENINAYAAGIR